MEEDLLEVQSIMRKNIEDILERGTKLEGRKVYPILNATDRYNADVSDKSRHLSEDSKKYKWGAKKLSLMVSNLVHDI
jgi:hypothetical protein